MSSLADISFQLNKVELKGMDHRTDDLLNSSNILKQRCKYINMGA